MEVKDLSILVHSFNCGEKFLSFSDLVRYVPEGKDVYLFSLQECMSPAKSIQAIDEFVNSKKQEYWIQSESIGSRLKILGYHGMITVVAAVRKSIVSPFSNLSPSTVYEGLNLGICRLGNKGSVGISLRFGRHSLLFVGSHFASDLKVGIRRMND